MLDLTKAEEYVKEYQKGFDFEKDEEYSQFLEQVKELDEICIQYEVNIDDRIDYAVRCILYGTLGLKHLLELKENGEA